MPRPHEKPIGHHFQDPKGPFYAIKKNYSLKMQR